MSISAEMKFSEAAASWLEMRDAGASRARYLKPRTIKTYRLELEALTLFFKDTRHCDVFITNTQVASQITAGTPGTPVCAWPERRGRIDSALPSMRSPVYWWIRASWR
jgi:hypothetical protein